MLFIFQIRYCGIGRGDCFSGTLFFRHLFFFFMMACRS
uniref:Uncharacterized protein n=1 Tax=Podoviridae sp. ctz6O13 TaxID=2827757 RepID=A0A8S5TK35_9CAUD|nr:MAG TPA: hypothetical protein [Podoviridae sp. ctz6O13]